MHMCIAFFVYLHLPASALPALRAHTRGFASAHSRARDCALSALRVRTHFSTPTHMCVACIVSRGLDIHTFQKKINIHAYFCMSMLAHVVIYS